MTPGFAKSRQELFWLPYPEKDRVIINAHNFSPPALIGTAFTVAPSSPTRNNFSGTLGYRFTATSSWVLRGLGRFKGSLNSGSHQVGIWSTGGTLLGSVIITTNSPIDALGWRSEFLSSPVSIVSGTSYHVGSTETSGGDNWKDNAPVAGSIDAGYVGSFFSFFSTTQNAFPGTSGSNLFAYCWPQLYR